MERSVTRQRVVALLAQVLGLPPERIGPGLEFQSIPAWSSLQQMMLVSQLESEFDVNFSNEEIASLVSFDRVVAALEQRLGGAA